MSRRAVVVLVVLAAGLSASSVVSVAGAQEQQPLLTPAEAKRVTREYNQKNAQNNATLNVEAQDMVEGPPIRDIDDAVFREFRGRGLTTLGEEGSKASEIRVAVPRQTTYPLQFLAFERFKGEDFDNRQVLAFERPSEGDPWRVTMAAQLAGSGPSRFPKLLADKDGYSALVDADHAGTLRAKPDTLASELVNVWSRAAGEERAPSKLFASGELSDGAIDRFISTLARSGIIGNVDFTFDVPDAPRFAYRTKDGGALVLFAVGIHERIVPIDSPTLEQPESRETFGGLIPPGKYPEVRYDRIALLAANVPAGNGAGAKKGARVKLIGVYGDDNPVQAQAGAVTPGTGPPTAA